MPKTFTLLSTVQIIIMPLISNFSLQPNYQHLQGRAPFAQDAACLTYADNSFDLCMTYKDLEHIPDYKAVISELYRVTKPGGHCTF